MGTVRSRRRAWGWGIGGVTALIATLASATAAPLPATRAVSNLSRGFSFEPPLTCVAEAPSDPLVIYVGGGVGQVFATRDGGVSWERSSLGTDRQGYRGALRAHGDSDAVDGPRPGESAGVETVGNLAVLTPDAVFTDDIFTYVGDRPAEFDPPVVGALDSAIADRRPGRIGDDDGAAFERDQAGWLRWFVRAKTGWSLGFGYALVLRVHQWTPIGVTALDVHPTDARDVLAATEDGLRRSRDGGYSWPRVLGDADLESTAITALARSDRAPERVWAGTADGLYRSDDGGDRWRSVDDRAVSVIALDPRDPARLLVGGQDGLARSTDGGVTFSEVFAPSDPRARAVHAVQFDPGDPRRVLVATGDGLFASHDDGATFARAGGLQFAGVDLRAVAVGSGPGQVVAADARDLWESRDGGDHWQVLSFGQAGWDLQVAAFSRHDPEALLLLTETELLRLARQAPRHASGEVVRAFRAQADSEPSAARAVAAAMATTGAGVEARMDYRRRSSWANLLPSVTAGLVVRDVDLAGSLIDRTRGVGGGDGPDFRNAARLGDLGVAVFAAWDLANTIFDDDEAAIGRVAWTLEDLEFLVRNTVVGLYQERRRLQLEALLARPDGSRAGLMRDLRIEELTAHLNALTGDLFEPFSAF